ncbi:S-layer homology domain-containing protein [Paenibacillus sp. FSL R10-2796]|uniref:S-layer homology domain-containing protein n=1 Tax=Paenibacillus sp. FSL R10-2796 TaxID=2954663 RepID=UPI0030DC10CF
MIRPLTFKKIVTLLLAASLLILPTQAGRAYANPDTAEAITSSQGGVNQFDYFSHVYDRLNDANHVFKTATYEDIVHLFESEGTYAVLVGGAWSENTQADIGFINEAAKEYGISTIYNFDTKLDGDTLQIADSNNKFAYKYVDLVNKYLKNLNLSSKDDPERNVSYTNTNGEVVTANKLESPFLLVYNKDHKDAQGNSAPVVSYLDKSYSWNEFLTNGTLDAAKVNAYKTSVSEVLGAATRYDTIDESAYIKAAFNKNYEGENEGKPTIFNEADGTLVYEHVTYHQLKQILASEGNYAILLGGSWCPNTQAVIKYINEYAKKHNIHKIYFFDTKLDAGVTVAEPNNNSGTKGSANPHNNNELQIRTTNHPYAQLYVDLVRTYLTNIKTENNTAAKPTVISYVDGLGNTVSGDRLQVPYLFTYNKDNKDAGGKNTPILGHVELMYSWTNIQPDYVQANYPIGARYNNTTTALDKIFSRLEAVPAGLTGVAPTAADNKDGQIVGTSSALEFKLVGDEAYTPVSGSAITGLAPGVYKVRYAATSGYQGPTSAAGPTIIPYNAGEDVSVEVPAYTHQQAAPIGLVGVAPTSEANDDGQITGSAEGQEYKGVGEADYKPVTGAVITGLTPGFYNVRYAAKEGYSVGKDATVEVPAYGEQAAPTGLVGVAPTSAANDDGKIIGTTKALEYKLSTVTDYVYASDVEIVGLVPGIYQVRYAAKEGFNAGRAADVIVPAFTAEQAAPTGLQGVAPTSAANNDGRITGTTTALEYKLSSVTNYVYAPDKEITGLIPGTYQVRYAAKEGYKASPATDIVVPAYVPISDPGTGGTGGSGGNSTPSTTTPTPSASPQLVATVTAGNTVNLSATAATKTDKTTGVTTATITKETAAEFVSLAKKAEADGKKAVLEIKVAATSDTQTADLTLPRSIINELAAGTKAEITIEYENVGTITFDAKSLASISAASDAGDIIVRIAKVSLTAEGKAVLGDRPVYDLSVIAGESTISTFGGGSVRVSVPYVLQAGERSDAVIVYHINSTGSLDNVRGNYNAAKGTVDFVTTHFSQYIIGYNQVSFADVPEASWYSHAVGFLAARSITSGTDAEHYSPNAAITRGQFIVLLLKAYDITPDAIAADNFADAGNTYYTNYLATAKRLGVATGSGDNQFQPDIQITRQELFTLLYRSLVALGELPSEKTAATLAGFSDAGQIAGYAQEALQALVERGVVTGANGKLNPKEVTTRAEAAQVIYNLLSK